MQEPKPTPELRPENEYIGELAERLRTLLGARLVGVYAGGSYALGDYRRPTSDLDLAAVVDPALDAETKRRIVDRVRHEALPCPARGLELVVYRLETARSSGSEADFELNLNSGRRMPLRVDESPATVAGHWFPIDRSILAQAGVTILGPPAGEVFAAVDRRGLLPVLVDSIRWHRRSGEDDAGALLAACRSLRFAEQGRWSSKPAALAWLLDQLETRLTETR
jgi:hypothetical protein